MALPRPVASARIHRPTPHTLRNAAVRGQSRRDGSGWFSSRPAESDTDRRHHPRRHAHPAWHLASTRPLGRRRTRRRAPSSLGSRSVGDLLALSARIIDEGVVDEPVNRVTNELSELTDGLADRRELQPLRRARHRRRASSRSTPPVSPPAARSSVRSRPGARRPCDTSSTPTGTPTTSAAAARSPRRGVRPSSSATRTSAGDSTATSSRAVGTSPSTPASSAASGPTATSPLGTGDGTATPAPVSTRRAGPASSRPPCCDPTSSSANITRGGG